jgi:hypothetical protein
MVIFVRRTCVNAALGSGIGAAVPLQVAVHQPGLHCLSGISISSGGRRLNLDPKLYVLVENAPL